MEGPLEVIGPADALAAKSQTRTMGAAATGSTGGGEAVCSRIHYGGWCFPGPERGAKAARCTRPQLVKYAIETVELDGKLDDGTTFTYWTFARKVPGPMLRVREGDAVEVALTNNRNS